MPTIRGSELEPRPVGRWVAEAYPVEQVETRADGSMRARLAVAAEAWFERLLVGWGGRPGWSMRRRRWTPGAASVRILDRYR